MHILENRSATSDQSRVKLIHCENVFNTYQTHRVWHARTCQLAILTCTRPSHSAIRKWNPRLHWYPSFRTCLDPPPSMSTCRNSIICLEAVLHVTVVISPLCQVGPMFLMSARWIHTPYVHEENLLFPMFYDAKPHVSLSARCASILYVLGDGPHLFLMF